MGKRDKIKAPVPALKIVFVFVVLSCVITFAFVFVFFFDKIHLKCFVEVGKKDKIKVPVQLNEAALLNQPPLTPMQIVKV